MCTCGWSARQPRGDQRAARRGLWRQPSPTRSSTSECRPLMQRPDGRGGAGQAGRARDPRRAQARAHPDGGRHLVAGGACARASQARPGCSTCSTPSSPATTSTNPKPHPEPYLMAARRLGVAPADCLAIEDSHSGVRAAHAAGMQTVMVPDLVQPIGRNRGALRRGDGEPPRRPGSRLRRLQNV